MQATPDRGAFQVVQEKNIDLCVPVSYNGKDLEGGPQGKPAPPQCLYHQRMRTFEQVGRDGCKAVSLAELFIIAVGLSMDAFAVSVCKGLSVQKAELRNALCVGAYFGGFQALMPLIGYLLGTQFQALITSVDHWVAFVLLALIGGNMIRESFGEEEQLDDCFTPKAMLPLAVATSIDALAMGVTFAFLRVNIVFAVIFIGVTTFALSAAGLKIGNIFGARFKTLAERFGGTVLVLMGVKILLEHLGVLG